MIKILEMMDHITAEVGVGDQAKYSFQSGYLAGIIEDLMLQIPEVKERVAIHARKYNYEGVTNG